MNKINIQGVNTDKLPRIEQSEVATYMEKIKSGDTQSKDYFVMANIKLVLSILHRYESKCDVNDLFQVGIVGLLKAIDGFDCKYGVRFSTYAVPMIMGEVRKFIKESNGIKVSRSMRDIAYNVIKTRQALQEKTNIEPSLMEVACEIDVPICDVVCALDAIGETRSIYESVYSDDEGTVMLMDQLGDSKQSEEILTTNIILRQQIKKLPPKEKDVVMMRYYFGNTQLEISKQLNISQAQVSRLEKSAISSIRQAIQ